MATKSTIIITTTNGRTETQNERKQKKNWKKEKEEKRKAKAAKRKTKPQIQRPICAALLLPLSITIYGKKDQSGAQDTLVLAWTIIENSSRSLENIFPFSNINNPAYATAKISLYIQATREGEGVTGRGAGGVVAVTASASKWASTSVRSRRS